MPRSFTLRSQRRSRNQFFESRQRLRRWSCFRLLVKSEKREQLLLLLTSSKWLVVIIYSLIYSSRREWVVDIARQSCLSFAMDARGIYAYTDILSLTSSDRKQNKMKVIFSCLLCRRFHHGIIDTFEWYANRLVDIFDQSTRTHGRAWPVCSSNRSNTWRTVNDGRRSPSMERV